MNDLNSKERFWLELGLGAIGAFLGVAIFCLAVLLWSPACAEGMRYSCWAFCQPGTEDHPNEVNIRANPGKHSEIVGAVRCGTQLWTDWEERNGWIHLVDVNNETGEGWISEQYIVFDIPYNIDAEGVIKGKGRVACRDGIDGKLIGWASPGDMLKVSWVSNEWAVTDRGYISMDYVEVP